MKPESDSDGDDGDDNEDEDDDDVVVETSGRRGLRGRGLGKATMKEEKMGAMRVWRMPKPESAGGKKLVNMAKERLESVSSSSEQPRYASSRHRIAELRQSHPTASFPYPDPFLLASPPR